MVTMTYLFKRLLRAFGRKPKCKRCRGVGGGKYLADASGLWQHCPYCDGTGYEQDTD